MIVMLHPTSTIPPCSAADAHTAPNLPAHVPAHEHGDPSG
eukprot:CAMPEP_0202917582 /NCGR_PEP_ID=MMETSP1392-20130828/71318_2 /ASSEMBLY_ACC=CAM_ASM_000868 /TAXON_ID=225041 /ORGANISM="Chlamydomonas chlamydogama, Strain SAG 11-48b" /LENGTH=39 /DNA_ID= /DNA_START= /DNA_END= /DNA_ORIENTATION=